MLKVSFKSIVFSLVVVLVFLVMVGSPKLGTLGVVDVVTATTNATTPATPAPPAASTPPAAKPPITPSVSTTSVSKPSEGTIYPLRRGSAGNDVRILQTLLNSYGYNLKVDGSFGKLTLDAVKDYQSKNGLVVDGIAGPKTFEKLIVKTATTTEATKPIETEKTKSTAPEGVDVVSTASLPATLVDFEKGISKDGRWIITPVSDIVSEKDLVVEGIFYNKDDETSNIYRKIGLYTQDADKNVTGLFTLTAPNLIIKSPNTRLQYGTFITDVYVEAEGFNLTNVTIEGNIYFVTQEAKDTFNMDEGSVVTGMQEMKVN